MTFAQLYAELQARGFDGLTTTRAKQIVNDAVTEIDMAYPWPYREKSGEGTAPLTVSDLGEIDAVTNETQDYPLEPATYGNLLNWFGDLTTSGSPEYFYVAWPSGVPVVATYPSNSNTIGVQYWKVPTALSADADTPAAPARFHNSVYLAVASRMAAMETGGDAARWVAEADRGLQAMVLSLLPDQLAGTHQRVSAWNSCDW